MHDVIPTTLRSDRLLLAVSFACFATAGIAAGNADALGPTLVATAVAITGVFCLAHYAARISRRTLAHLSLAFWVAFLVISGLHVIGLEAVGNTVPGTAEIHVLSLIAITWGTLLTACGATAFLGFREYGAASSADTPEDGVLEGEASEYSTR
ncbi:hypothetical protein [Natronorubrum halophilum]|uniref:hypothetical protein n=1 Tax=Natronorubrum halophilum TaxID=1702106 RepID=UPI000EF680E2|nr:hypothetical protein [Natronorubrum halophilum]